MKKIKNMFKHKNAELNAKTFISALHSNPALQKIISDASICYLSHNKSTNTSCNTSHDV